MTEGHNKVEYCSGTHLKKSSFRSKDLSLALALSLGSGLRRIVARLRGVLGAPPPKSSTARVRGVLGHLPHTAALWLAVASHCCSN